MTNDIAAALSAAEGEAKGAAGRGVPTFLSSSFNDFLL
jgi:hypothetical protein